MIASPLRFLPSPGSPSLRVPQPNILRRLRVLRLSVTELCNFRCRYCMPMEGVAKRSCRDLLRLEDLAALVAWLSAHTNIDRIKLTGGEPLIRRGLGHLVAQLSSLAGIREISMTTNGSLLPQMASALKAAGLSRVNISLDSLDERRFSEISRGGRLQRTLAGIDAARKAGLLPIKLNTVLQRSTWRREMPNLLDYAAENGFEIRFIELMHTGTNRAWCESEFVSVDEIRRELGAKQALIPIEEANSAPARKTSVDWHGCRVAVGWIAARSHPFCGRCERLRMDARGLIRRCLMDPGTLNLPHLLEIASPAAAVEGFESYIAGKSPPRIMGSSMAMNRIGG